jgi:hypothetical protein
MGKAWHRGTGKLIPDMVTPFMWHLSDDRKQLWRQLEFRRKAFEAGHLGAALDALCMCFEFDWALPEWLKRTVIDCVEVWLLKGPCGPRAKEWQRRGREWRKRSLQDLVDFDRVRALQEARARGFKWAVSRAGELDAYEYAGRKLLPKRTKAGTVKKSYQRFKHNWKREPFRYYLLTTTFFGAIAAYRETAWPPPAPAPQSR